MGDISSELSTTRVNWHPAHNTPAQREETQVLSTMEHEDRREHSPTWVMEYQEVASHYMTGVPTKVDTPDILKDCFANISTQQIRPQWIQKDLWFIQKQILLERNEEISTPTLHKLPSMCQTTTSKHNN